MPEADRSVCTQYLKYFSVQRFAELHINSSIIQTQTDLSACSTSSFTKAQSFMPYSATVIMGLQVITIVVERGQLETLHSSWKVRCILQIYVYKEVHDNSHLSS